MHRRIIILFIFLFVAALASAQLSVRLSAAPSVRVPLTAGPDLLGPGYGGTLEIAIAPEALPLELGLGLGLHGFLPARAEIETATMLTPSLALRYAPTVPWRHGTLTPRFGVAYRHYVARHTFDGEPSTTYRPIVALLGGVEANLSPSFSLGPTVAYELLLERDLRHVIDLGLRATFTL